jgi:hypothetical protein
MPYDGTSGMKTVFPTVRLPGEVDTPSPRSRAAKKSPGRSKPRKAKRSCKYGPRGSDGLCPKKPRASIADRALAKIGGIKATTRGKQSVVTRLQRKAEGRVGSLFAGAALAKSQALKTGAQRTIARLAGPGVKGTVGAGLKAIARAPVSRIVSSGAAGFAGTLGAVALAGIASYAITTKILNIRKKRRMDRAELAAAAADAYRAARLRAEEEKGAPLTRGEQLTLATEFKSQLEALGLSTTNLKGL